MAAEESTETTRGAKELNGDYCRVGVGRNYDRFERFHRRPTCDANQLRDLRLSHVASEPYDVVTPVESSPDRFSRAESRHVYLRRVSRAAR